MTDDNEYFEWLENGGRIRVSIRAVILDRQGTQVLVERKTRQLNSYWNFIGGGLAVGESFRDCLERKLGEETDARIVRAEYLFVVENFFRWSGQIRHSVEHYLEVGLDREGVTAADPATDYQWIRLEDLARVDLRPHAILDRLADGSFREKAFLSVT